MVLFVVPANNQTLSEATKEEIRDLIRKDVSPRFVPDEILAIPEVPRTLNGKKMEVPIKRILMGVPPEKALSVDSMSNPRSLDFFLDYRSKVKR